MVFFLILRNVERNVTLFLVSLYLFLILFKRYLRRQYPIQSLKWEEICQSPEMDGSQTDSVSLGIRDEMLASNTSIGIPPHSRKVCASTFYSLFAAAKR